MGDHLLQHPTLQAQSDASLAHQQSWVSQRLFSRRVMELSPRLETESPSSTLVIRRTHWTSPVTLRMATVVSQVTSQLRLILSSTLSFKRSTRGIQTGTFFSSRL